MGGWLVDVHEKCQWIEFALGKVLVGKVPGFISVVWGYHFACKIKNIVD